MARSYGVIKQEVWEPGSDFRRDLSPDAQWAYWMLTSQPQINNLGILDYTPERWVRLARGLDRGRLQEALDELADHRYTIVDVDTGEILVRTFVYHDKVWSQPTLVKNARSLIRTVESDRIRLYLIDRHPWLVEDWTVTVPQDFTPAGVRVEQRPAAWEKQQITLFEQAHETPPERGLERGLDTPLADGAERPLQRGVSRGVSPPRARAGAGAGEGAGPSSKPLEPDQELGEQGSAAADADNLPPTDTEVEQAARTFKGFIPKSMGKILPLARQLPAPLFHDAVRRTQTRIQAGGVDNHCGYLIEMLSVTADEAAVRAAAEHAAAQEAWTAADQIALDSASYARSGCPWDAALELLDRKIARLTDNPDERQELRDLAADTYDNHTPSDDRATVADR